MAGDGDLVARELDERAERRKRDRIVLDVDLDVVAEAVVGRVGAAVYVSRVELVRPRTGKAIDLLSDVAQRAVLGEPVT